VADVAPLMAAVYPSALLRQLYVIEPSPPLADVVLPIAVDGVPP
jgi:hypothetical protein